MLISRTSILAAISLTISGTRLSAGFIWRVGYADLNRVRFLPYRQMLLHVLKQTTVSGTLEVSPNKCNKFCHESVPLSSPNVRISLETEYGRCVGLGIRAASRPVWASTWARISAGMSPKRRSCQISQSTECWAIMVRLAMGLVIG